jgi:thiol:disulfide interchange protein
VLSNGQTVNIRTIVGNVLAIALLATAVWAFVVDQKDKAATRPATENQITQYRLDFALKKARAQRRFLMVEFGADWCEDCRVLARNLDDESTRDYFQSHFNLLGIDIGHSDRNFKAAEILGLDLSHGIPAAVFFAPDGSRIGATNNGELEPSRNYRPAQILAFLRDVTERRIITTPAAFQ